MSCVFRIVYYSFPLLHKLTGSQLLFFMFTILLHLWVLDSSASSLFPLPFPTSVCVFLYSLFLLATRLTFTQAICYLPCKIHIHTIFTCCLYIISRIICATLFFSNYFLCLIIWIFLQLFSKSPFLCSAIFSLICNALSRYHNCTVKCFPPLCKIFISLYIMQMCLLQSRLT
jgi:hypothetical protein